MATSELIKISNVTALAKSILHYDSILQIINVLKLFIHFLYRKHADICVICLLIYNILQRNVQYSAVLSFQTVSVI